MDKEIKKNSWSRFCAQFNATNQYRPTKISVKRRGEGMADIEMTPFMGMALSKKGRLIDGVQFYAGQWNPDMVAQPVLTIGEPTQIWLEQDKSGHDNSLRIRSKDGTEVHVQLFGDRQADQARRLVERVAYAMYENRGYESGHDWSDWFEAEQRVRQAEMELTK